MKDPNSNYLIVNKSHIALIEDLMKGSQERLQNINILLMCDEKIENYNNIINLMIWYFPRIHSISSYWKIAKDVEALIDIENVEYNIVQHNDVCVVTVSDDEHSEKLEDFIGFFYSMTEKNNLPIFVVDNIIQAKKIMNILGG